MTPAPSARGVTAGPSLWPVGGFTVGYLLLAVAGAVRTGNLEFVFYIGVMVVLVAAVWMVHRRVTLTGGALWALSAWGALHMAGGLVPLPAGWPINGEVRVLYSLWLIPGLLKFDHLVHVYGFGVTTWVCWQGLRSALAPGGTTGVRAGGSADGATGRAPEPVRPTAGLLVLCAAAGMGFGALNEVVEFSVTLLVPETNVGGYLNTGWDMVANAVGATVAVVWIRLRGGPAAIDGQWPDETDGPSA